MNDENKAKAYSRWKIRLKLLDYGLDVVLLAGFLLAGGSVALRMWVESWGGWWWTAVLGYALIFGAGYSLLLLPLRWFGGHQLEHRYGLSTQTLGRWFCDWLKETLVSALLAAVMLFVLYGLLHYAGQWWWVICGAAFSLFFVVLAQLAPVLIFPLFYKFKPVEDEALRERLESLAQAHGSNVRGVFEMNLSSKTRAANAALTGFGRTRRILLADTLLRQFDHAEIEAVLAHEFGHHAHRHMLKGIALQAGFFFVFLFLVDRLLRATGDRFGFTGLDDVANLPLIGLGSVVIGLLLLPPINGLMRRYERQADRYALRHSPQPRAFLGALRKLARMNLADPNPHPAVEFIFYSHPAIARRIGLAEDWLAAHGIKEDAAADPATTADPATMEEAHDDAPDE